MVAGLNGGKMSSSDPGKHFTLTPLHITSSNDSSRTDSKIDLLDPPEAVAKKVRKSEAIPRTIESNGVIALVEYVLLPAAKLNGKNEFRVERRDAEPLIYTDIQQLKDDYMNDVVCQFECASLLQCSKGHC